MKGKRYTEEQIVSILREVDSGKSIVKLCRQYGVSEATLRRWRRKFGSMGLSEVKRLKQLEAENVRLKKIVVQQALDNDALRELLSKK